MEHTQELMKEKIYKYTSIDIKDSSDFDITSCGIGGRIWKSAVVLACFFKNKDFSKYVPITIEGKVVVEIGAGTGVCGLVAASLNAKKVYLTDRDEGCLELLQKNVELNKNKFNSDVEVEVSKLDWTCKEDFLNMTENIDIILGSDLLYSLSMIDNLISALELLCNKAEDSNNKTIVILALASRGEEYEVFVNKITELGTWIIEVVPEEILEEKYYKNFIIILKKL